MESPNPATQKPQYKTVKTRFGEVFNAATSLFKTNAFAFMGLYAASVILGVLLSMAVGLLPLKGDGEDINLALVIGAVIVLAVVRWAIQLLGMNAVLRGSYLADTGKFSFGDAFTYGLGKIGKAMDLSVRVFFYTGAWALAIVSFLYLGGTFLALMGMGNGTKELAGMFAILGPISMFMPLIFIILLFFMIRRICSAAFSFPILLSRDSISSKDALKESISLTSGLTGTVFSNFFIYALLAGIFAGIISGICAYILGMIMPAPKGGLSELMEYSQNLADYASIIPGIMVGSLTIVFQYAFMKKMMEEKADQGGWETQEAQPGAPGAAPVNPQPPVSAQIKEPSLPKIKMVE